MGGLHLPSICKFYVVLKWLISSIHHWWYVNTECRPFNASQKIPSLNITHISSDSTYSPRCFKSSFIILQLQPFSSDKLTNKAPLKCDVWLPQLVGLGLLHRDEQDVFVAVFIIFSRQTNNWIHRQLSSFSTNRLIASSANDLMIQRNRVLVPSV